MGTAARADPADILARVAGHWGWTFTFGLIAVVAGALVIFWPRETVVILAIIFGIQLVLDGVGELMDAFAPSAISNQPRWLVGLMGALSIVVGIICLKNILLTIVAIAVLLGIYLVFHGAVRVLSAIGDKAIPARPWAVLLGFITVLAGIALLVYPGVSLLYAAIVLGAFLIVSGAIRIGIALLLRRVAGGAARWGAAT